jgi:type I restriction enzyme M protein
VRVLTERYGQTLPQIMQDLAGLEARVAGHLAAMGVAG